MRFPRNRTVTLTLSAVLVIGLVVGVVIASWEVVAVVSATVSVAWLTWVSRRVHITASEVRRLGASPAATSEAVDRLAANAALLHESAERAQKEALQENKRVEYEFISAIDLLRKEVVERIESGQGSVASANRVENEPLLQAVGHTEVFVDRTNRQLNRVVRRQVEIYGMVEMLEASLTARMDQLFDEIGWELRRSRREATELLQRLKDSEMGREVAAVHHDADSRSIIDLQKYLYYLSYHVPREIEAQQQLQTTYEPEGLRPLLGGWALTPTGMLDIAHAISRDAPDVVVECGSGTSTVWIALALRASGGGHVYSLEHDTAFAEETRLQLSAQGLSAFATVIDAPIIEQNGSRCVVDWYDLSGLSHVESIDILVVDGPPQTLGDLRKHAMELLSDRFVDGTRVFADDVNRSAERTMVSDWVEAYPSLQRRVSSTPVQSQLIWTTGERP